MALLATEIGVFVVFTRFLELLKAYIFRHINKAIHFYFTVLFMLGLGIEVRHNIINWISTIYNLFSLNFVLC